MDSLEAALELGFLTEEQFDRVVDPVKMVRPCVPKDIDPPKAATPTN
jgi:fumarate hydratase class II